MTRQSVRVCFMAFINKLYFSHEVYLLAWQLASTHLTLNRKKTSKICVHAYVHMYVLINIYTYMDVCLYVNITTNSKILPYHRKFVLLKTEIRRLKLRLCLLSTCPAKVLLAQLYPILCNSIGCSPPGSSVHGLLHVRILEWVAMSFSWGSSQSKSSNPGLPHYRQILYHLS